MDSVYITRQALGVLNKPSVFIRMEAIRKIKLQPFFDYYSRGDKWSNGQIIRFSRPAAPFAVNKID